MQQTVQHVRGVLVALAASALLAGCITVGAEFPHAAISQLEPGKTTQSDVRDIFGDPIRVGVDDGQLEWSYANYRASLFGAFEGRDLVIKFDQETNRVASYSYHTTHTADEDMGKHMSRGR